jgi:hypothetical protein
MGYLVDELQRKHGIYPLESASLVPSPQQWAAYSLKDVLARNVGVQRRFTQHDKLRVAVHLASSVLQLHKTSWLDDDFGERRCLLHLKAWDVYQVHI